jgi:hypothetical protein
MGSTGQKIMELRHQMGVEEKARFTAQIEAITRPLIDIVTEPTDIAGAHGTGTVNTLSFPMSRRCGGPL